jgi:hypothetical protein
MKCPKCSYVSYEYLDACRKCSVDLVDFKKTLHLDAVRPGDLDLSLMLTERSGQGNAASFNIDDDFFSAQTMLVEREERPEEEAGFDISLDDEAHETPRRTGTLSGAAADITDRDDFVSFEDEEEDDTARRPLSAKPSMSSAAPVAPGDMIDMSDLEDLDDISLDLDEPPGHTETISSEVDTTVMTRPPAPLAEPPSESASPDIVFELSDVEDDDASTPSVPLETAAESTDDDAFEAAMELELEGGDERRSAEPEADLQIDLDTFDLGDDDAEDKPKQS